MAHFNWLQNLPYVNHGNIHVATAAVVSVGIVAMGVRARLALGTGEQAVVPARSFSIRGFFEMITEGTFSIADMVLGKEAPKYIPLAAAVFTFVFINNLVGLIPGMTPATDNFNTSFAIGMFSFVYYNYIGIRYDGLAYFKHFLGPVWWLIPLMLPIELISHAFRPLTLGLRLMGNITADHTVLAVFHDLTPIGVPVAFYMMGLIVSTIQAFVFALLTLVYVMLAKSHDH